jgi:copper transport protein
MLRLLAPLIMTCVVFGVCGAPSARAHASLVEATPGDGAILERAPEHVSLRFNELVSPLRMRLIGPDGRARDALTAIPRNEIVVVGLPQDLATGTHLLSWRVVSADGHPVSGSFVFSIGRPSAWPTSISTEDSGDARLPPLIWLTRIGSYVGAFVGVGGAFFSGWIAPQNSAPLALIKAALSIGFLGTLVSVGLQGLDAFGAPLDNLWTRPVWTAGLETALGLTAIALLLAVLTAHLSLVATKQLILRRVSSAVALILVGVAFALSGHASAAEPQWLTRPAVFIHCLGVAFWTGAFLPLLALLRRPQENAIEVVRHFSSVALAFVGAMVLSGGVLAIVQVQAPRALIETAYGRLLLAKLALATGLFALAALNRFIFTPRLVHVGEAGEGRKRLASSIAVEVVFTACLLGVIAGWRFTPPPRALAAAAAESARVHIHTRKVMADVTLTPGRVGPARAIISVMSGDFGPLDPREVTLILSHPGAGIEPMERRAVKADNGRWRVDRLLLPLPGRWRVRVDVLVSEFEKAILEDAIEIRQ